MGLVATATARAPTERAASSASRRPSRMPAITSCSVEQTGPTASSCSCWTSKAKDGPPLVSGRCGALAKHASAAGTGCPVVASTSRNSSSTPNVLGTSPPERLGGLVIEEFKAAPNRKASSPATARRLPMKLYSPPPQAMITGPLALLIPRISPTTTCRKEKPLRRSSRRTWHHRPYLPGNGTRNDGRDLLLPNVGTRSRGRRPVGGGAPGDSGC